MANEIRKAVQVTAKEAQYDENAKKLLAQKSILSHILVRTVDEFRGRNPKTVAKLIEGEPYISVVPVDPGLTNAKVADKNGESIVGMNTEAFEINEGMVRFDIIFYVRLSDGLSQIIVNLEAQKDDPSAYDILNRAIFYVSRMVSSQKERDFKNSHYNDLKKVYSIWICMNMKENCMEHIHLTREQLVGTYHWKGKLDLLNIVMIGLTNKPPEKGEYYELHRLLGTLLSMHLSATEKLNVMEQEYSIPVNEDIREDVRIMCNLSQGIKEEGMVEGLAKGEVRKLIFQIKKKLSVGKTLEQIADEVEETVEETRPIVDILMEHPEYDVDEVYASLMC